MSGYRFVSRDLLAHCWLDESYGVVFEPGSNRCALVSFAAGRLVQQSGTRVYCDLTSDLPEEDAYDGLSELVRLGFVERAE